MWADEQFVQGPVPTPAKLGFSPTPPFGRESAANRAGRFADSHSGPLATAPAGPTILVVDDTPINLDVARSVLEEVGFRVLTAGNGPQARDLSRMEQPDLILLDVLMPGETGFETCARLKSGVATADIPIIFLSSLDDVKSKVAGLKMGAVDYIAKPMHGEEVLARVRVHLRIRETNRALVGQQRARLEQLGNAQQSILVRPEDCPEANFEVYYRPLEEAGGDFYDILPLGAGVFGYFVADISGHGVSAAYLTSAIKALLRQYGGPVFSPEDTMRGVNSVMVEMMGEEQYLTACYARLNRHTHRLTIVGAGHPPLILVRRGGAAQAVEMEAIRWESLARRRCIAAISASPRAIASFCLATA